ncbi:MAG: DNA-3-methyladenine glycosylase [Anaerolineales bacterium]|jgi:DNA-3-methyladenine glycosylase
MGNRRLSRSFFQRPTLRVARDLLGTRLVRLERVGRTSGWVVEVEAYVGEEDLGSHASHGRTARNKVMFGQAGRAYVYFTYGMHWMLNVVTEVEAFPAAVLLRALWPLEGVARMRKRRGRLPLADGPARLCEALAVDRRFNGQDLCERSSKLYLERGVDIPDRFVTRGSRVGLYSVPEPWKSRPWRFRVSPEGTALLRTGEGAHQT